MATNSWIGNLLTGGAWGTAGNWSGGVPISTSNIDFNRAWTGDPTISTPNSAIAFTDITAGDTSGGPNQINITSGGAASIWTPVAGAFIDTTLVNQLIQFQPGFAGAVQIAKKGPGLLYANTGTGTPPVTHSGGWDVQGGGLGATVTGRLGTGLVTLAAGAQYGNVGGGAITLANNVTVLGDVYLNAFPAWDGAARQALTISGSVALPATTATLNVGNTFASPVTISGPLLGDAGFTKAGAGTLTVSNTASTLTGTVTLNTTGGYTSRTTLLGSGATTPLAGSGLTYHFPNAGAGGYLEYAGNSSLATVQASFTSAAANYGFISTYTNGGVSFAPAAAGGVSGYQGTWEVSQDNTVTAPLLVLNEFPTSASYLQYDTFGTTTATSTIRIIAASGGTTAATIQMGAGASGTHTYVLEDNSSAATVYSGAATKVAAQAGTLSLRGSNTSATISGNITVAAGTLAMNKQGVGKWILSGANTYTGTTSVSAGTLSAQSAGAFGTSGAVTQTGGTIDVSGGVALTKTGAAFTLISAAGANALTTTTGTNTLACAGITLSSTIIVDAAAGASLTVNNTAAMSGAFGITKNNSGEIGLGTFANTYTGAVTINAGTLTVGNLQNTSTASSLGTGALTSAISLTGTLKYAGTAPAGHSTNRSLTFTGAAPALDASGSGAVTYSAATQAAGARTITFTGSSTAANTLSAALSDGTGAVSVAKSGAGKWVLSNATVNYTGTTTISDGTLDVSGANRTLTGGVSISGGTLASTGTVAANTTMTGGTVTAELTGNKTLDVDSGTATLQPTANANTFTGATTVDAGAILRLITGANPSLGGGKVLGDSDVSVSGDLKTAGSAIQRGQMRYGGDLIFQTGAKLYVGGA